MSLKSGAKCDSGGFVKVVYKRKKRRKTPQYYHSSVENVTIDAAAFHKKIIDIQHELKYSEFIQRFEEAFWNAFKICFHERDEDNAEGIESVAEKLGEMSLSRSVKSLEIVCYGLGRFLSCAIGQYQLGLLLILEGILNPVDINIYDPLFSEEERCILKVLGFNVLEHNEECKRTVKKFTIFYMPHCESFLYNNVLLANWSLQNLSKIIIIGNSFKSYALGMVSSKLKQDARYLYYAEHVVTEQNIMNIFKFKDIFNDLAIHYFIPKDLLPLLPESLKEHEEPLCSDEDLIKKVLNSYCNEM